VLLRGSDGGSYEIPAHRAFTTLTSDTAILVFIILARY